MFVGSPLLDLSLASGCTACPPFLYGSPDVDVEQLTLRHQVSQLSLDHQVSETLQDQGAAGVPTRGCEDGLGKPAGILCHESAPNVLPTLPFGRESANGSDPSHPRSEADRGAADEARDGVRHGALSAGDRPADHDYR